MNKELSKTPQSLAPLPCLKALADPTRLRLLRLVEREELTVKELTDILGMTQSRVSSHLSVLREVGLLRDRRRGTSSLYSLEKDTPAIGLWLAVKPSLAMTKDEQGDQTRLKQFLARRQDLDREFFDRAAASWDGLRSENLGLHAGPACLGGLLDGHISVLEIGTGTGSLLPLLAQQIDYVIAMDSSRGMLLRAQERMGKAQGKTVQLTRGDLMALPLQTSSVDGVIMNMVLHHLPDPMPAFREVYRVLVPGGRAVIIDFEAHNERRLLDEENHRWPGFEPAQLSAWGLDAGFSIPTVLPIPTPGSGRWSRLSVFSARFIKRGGTASTGSDTQPKQEGDFRGQEKRI